MNNWKDRLKEEHKTLKERTQKLGDFICSWVIGETIDEENRELLKKQYNVMRQYQEILEQRMKINNISEE